MEIHRDRTPAEWDGNPQRPDAGRTGRKSTETGRQKNGMHREYQELSRVKARQFLKLYLKSDLQGN